MAGTNKVESECVFCGKTIPIAGFDPCQLVLITNWTEPREHQLEQVFFCHAECFRRLVRPGSPTIPLVFALGERWWEDR